MQLTPLIRKYLTQKNKELGYKNTVWDYYCIQTSSDFEYLIRYDYGTYTGYRSVAPYVILRHYPSEVLYRELFCASEKEIPCLSLFYLNLGEINQAFNKYWDFSHMKEWRSKLLNCLPSFMWFHYYEEFFYTENEVQKKCERIMKRVQRQSLPFLRKISNLDILVDLYERQAAGTWPRTYLLPILYLQVGKKQEGIDFMNRPEWKEFMNNDRGRLFYKNYCKYEYNTKKDN